MVRTLRSPSHFAGASRLGAAALLLAAVAAGLVGLTPAQANHACPPGSVPVHYLPPTDPTLNVWEVEGKITAFNRTSRTMTANGLTFSLPAALGVKTLDLDQAVANLTFERLTDPTLEAQRTILGGTVIGGGATVYTTGLTGTCMSLVADSVFIELAENGIIGTLMAVDPAAGSLLVSGATVRMNTDPRFPSDLVDLAGEPIPLADLVDQVGTLMDVGGYFEAGVLRGTAVQVQALRKQAGTDTVGIEKALYSSGRVRVVGTVSKHSVTGAFAATVDVYAGAINAAGTGCTGLLLGSALTSPGAPGLADFSFDRRDLSSAPASVCVASPGGGVDDSPVALK